MCFYNNCNTFLMVCNFLSKKRNEAEPKDFFRIKDDFVCICAKKGKVIIARFILRISRIFAPV